MSDMSELRWSKDTEMNYDWVCTPDGYPTLRAFKIRYFSGPAVGRWAVDWQPIGNALITPRVYGRTRSSAAQLAMRVIDGERGVV